MLATKAVSAPSPTHSEMAIGGKNVGEKKIKKTPIIRQMVVRCMVASVSAYDLGKV